MVRPSPKSLDVSFGITDLSTTVPCSFSGPLPDLFREGQSVVVEGTMKEGRFYATEVLAKHDENYMPAEVAEAVKQKRAEQTGQQ